MLLVEFIIFFRSETVVLCGETQHPSRFPLKCYCYASKSKSFLF